MVTAEQLLHLYKQGTRQLFKFKCRNIGLNNALLQQLDLLHGELQAALLQGVDFLFSKLINVKRDKAKVWPDGVVPPTDQS